MAQKSTEEESRSQDLETATDVGGKSVMTAKKCAPVIKIPVTPATTTSVPKTVAKAPKVRLPRRSVQYRDWLTSENKRRCQHMNGKKQCHNDAEKGRFTCSDHSSSHEELQWELPKPFGPKWMKNLKRQVLAQFGKDLDFWTLLPLEMWTKASNVIDVALAEIPGRAEEIYKAIGEADEEEGLRPAARLARVLLREKYKLNQTEQTKLKEADKYLYNLWEMTEYRAIFGYNGSQKRTKQERLNLPYSLVSDNRTRAQLKVALPSINPQGQIMFLEACAINAEDELKALAGKKPRGVSHKDHIEVAVSKLYGRVQTLKQELATSPSQEKSKELATAQSRLDQLVQKREEVRSLREQQAKLVGVDPKYWRPAKWFWKITDLRENGAEKEKTVKRTGNRGKNSSKRTSKKRNSKRAAGVGHSASVRGRFSGASHAKDWDAIIADNISVVHQAPTPKQAPVIKVPAIQAPVVQAPTIKLPVMNPVGVNS